MKTRSTNTVGVKELKDRLTHYLRRTKQGEEVIVTERGKPTALLQAIKTADEAASIEARLSRLAALGAITLPTRRTRQKPKPMKVSGPPVSKAILDDRQ